MENGCSVKGMETCINLSIHSEVETIKKLGFSRYLTLGR